ncbi:MAG: FHA domain-containing protein [Chloroflexota bacterium]|nr:MAG: FHA domain-containing protein [Chloroflexota bacterium]
MSATVLLIFRILMVAVLYAFLGLALFTIWRDLRRQVEAVSSFRSPAITLLSTKGEPVCRFAKPEVIVGRDPACDCPLDDKTVSTRHARFSFHHNQWWLEDMGSTNGTLLNREPVSSPLVVTSGDQLCCGQVEMTIIIGDSGAVEGERND